eukprot:scaffold1799_cov225-Pinguiococcus_pyrenoidosus.AAC.5
MASTWLSGPAYPTCGNVVLARSVGVQRRRAAVVEKVVALWKLAEQQLKYQMRRAGSRLVDRVTSLDPNGNLDVWAPFHGHGQIKPGDNHQAVTRFSRPSSLNVYFHHPRGRKVYRDTRVQRKSAFAGIVVRQHHGNSNSDVRRISDLLSISKSTCGEGVRGIAELSDEAFRAHVQHAVLEEERVASRARHVYRVLLRVADENGQDWERRARHLHRGRELADDLQRVS